MLDEPEKANCNVWSRDISIAEAPMTPAARRSRLWPSSFRALSEAPAAASNLMDSAFADKTAGKTTGCFSPANEHLVLGSAPVLRRIFTQVGCPNNAA